MITACSITELLRQRHAEDTFVSQCKNGPTQHQNVGDLLIMDAWALARSWARPKMTAYEIKVSRSDFLRDDKWRRALEYCNEFYWVAPYDVIAVDEVAEGCGLLTPTKNGTRLLTKKRAAYRQVEPPINVLLYILICRANVKREGTLTSDADYWRTWYALREENRELGHNVSRSLQKLVEARITRVEGENKRLRDSFDTLSRMLPILKEVGLAHEIMYDDGRHLWEPRVSAAHLRERTLEALRHAQNVVQPWLIRSLRSVADDLEKLYVAEEESRE